MGIRLTLLAVAAFGCASRLHAEPDRAAHLKKLELVMGPLPGADRKVPLDVRVTETVPLDGTTRKTLSYAAEADRRVPAYLLLPDPARFPGKRPAMLCLHPTNALGKGVPAGLDPQASKHFAAHLVSRGYVCLAPDYPSFGDLKGYDFKAAFASGKYQSGTMIAVWNHIRGVDLLQSLPDVDPARIGAVGHSLGGHNALFVAAFDDRVKVAVTSCGWNSFAKYYGGNLKGWAQDRYMPWIATEYGLDPKRVPFDFDDVLLAICPRAVFSNSPLRDANFEVSGVKDIEAKVAPAYRAAGAADNLRIVYPDAAHEFPDDAKRQAYGFLDRWLTP
jgi:dienelactone hydrolase